MGDSYPGAVVAALSVPTPRPDVDARVITRWLARHEPHALHHFLMSLSVPLLIALFSASRMATVPRAITCAIVVADVWYLWPLARRAWHRRQIARNGRFEDGVAVVGRMGSGVTRYLRIRAASNPPVTIQRAVSASHQDARLDGPIRVAIEPRSRTPLAIVVTSRGVSSATFQRSD